MALAQISSSLSLSVRDVYAFSSPKTSSATPRLPLSKLSPCGSVFATGSPLLIRRTCYQKQPAGKAMSLSIRCEQGTQDNSLDVWLGRFAMIGFAVAITVEITTGKGLLEVCHMDEMTMNNQFEEPDQPMQSIYEIMQIIAEATIPAAGTPSLNQYLTGSLDIDDDMEEDLETDLDLDIDSSGEIVYAM